MPIPEMSRQAQAPAPHLLESRGAEWRFSMNILGYRLGLIMRLLYTILHSYGWSLILFTLMVRLVLVPLSIKQQKSSAKMAAIQPQMQEIQKMYAKNQTKMNEELQKLYQREKYNPA